MQKLIIFFCLLAASIYYFVFNDTNKVKKPKYNWYYTQADAPLQRQSQCKAIICGDTIDYYCASYVRCDELYKYQHYIGKGKFLRNGEEMYFYNPNSGSRFVTVEELEKEYGQKVYFTDVYQCEDGINNK